MKRVTTIGAVAVVIVMMIGELARAACVALIQHLKDEEDQQLSADLVILEAEMIVVGESLRRSQDEHPSQEYPDSHG